MISTSTFFEKFSNIFESNRVYYEDVSRSNMNKQFKIIVEWIQNTPELDFENSQGPFRDFEIWFEHYFGRVDLVIEHSNGWTTSDGQDTISLTFLETSVEHKFVQDFLLELENRAEKTTKLIPKRDSNSVSLFNIRIVGDRIKVFYGDGNEDWKLFNSKRKKQLPRCECKQKAKFGVLTNGPVSEDRVLRLLQIASTGCWDGFFPGRIEELCAGCDRHSMCQFQSSGECEGHLKLVTTFVNNSYHSPKVHGFFYCDKHAPPSFMTPVWKVVGTQ